MTQQKRCFGTGKDFYEKYHDEEWGKPIFDDQKLFEMLCLEGAQAGLSWETVLKKRSGYKDAFYHFDPIKVSTMSKGELAAIIKNPNVIRNRLKIFSVVKNAKIFIKIQEEFGSFSNYIWGFVDHTPIINHHKTHEEVPASTPLSDTISKDLKKRGMSFVGSTIIYAFMQAVGMVNDHLTSCPCK